MGNSISIGDTVLHSDRWGNAPASLTRITGIVLCEAPGEKKGIVCDSADAAAKDRLCVLLENGEMAFGYQIECVPHESITDPLRHFVMWFVNFFQVQGLTVYSHICRMLSEELAEELAGDGIGVVCAHLSEGYHSLVSLRAGDQAVLLQQIHILASTLTETRTN